MRPTQLLFFFFGFIFCYAQENQKLDSLFRTHIKSAPTKLKVFFLHDDFNKALYNNPKEAKDYASEILDISKNADYKLGIAVGNNLLGMFYDTIEKIDSAGIHYQKSYDQYQSINNLEGVTTTMHNMAILEFTEGNYKETLELINKKIELQLSAEKLDPLGLAQSHMLKGQTYSGRGDYNLALKEVLMALRTFDELDELVLKADALGALSNIENYLENHEKSIEYALKAIPIYQAENDLTYEAMMFSYLGSSYYKLKRYDQALDALEEALKLTNQVFSPPSSKADIYHTIGKIHIAKKDFKKGFEFLHRGLEVLQKAEMPDNLAAGLIGLGRSYIEADRPQNAISCLDSAIVLLKTTGAKKLLQSGYKARAEANEQLGKTDEAFKDLKTSLVYKDSIFNLITSNQIQEFRAIYDAENKENQITILKQREEVSDLQLLLMGIGLLLSLIGFYAIRQKMKRNKLEKEKVDAELEYKRKELTTHALNLARKNETLENLKLKALELKEKESNGVGYNQLIHSINFDLQDDNNWKNFSRYFEEVHKDFNSNVKTKYPQVTSNELRLLALLKMNLSSKEIANILSISPEGIKKARYRLRKKLDLSTEDSLQDLVLSL